ncbi:hypothetical protein ACHAPU_006272 [Fusarium lateritium]
MFRIRDAGSTLRDAEFITAAFDSCLPFLTQTGNTGQWGTTPFSQKDGFLEGIADDIAQSEIFRLNGQGQRRRIFIAEIEDFNDSNKVKGLHRRSDDMGRSLVAVGAAMILDNEFASHTHSIAVLGPHIAAAEQGGNFIFLDFLIADHRVGSAGRKGAGVALLEHIKAYAHQHEKSAMFLDCWTGGTDNLVRYYENVGFNRVEDFQYKKKNGDVWPGRLFRLDIASG